MRTTSLTGPATMAVTPVRATPRPAGGSGSSRQTVVWPTRTPRTSVMPLLSGTVTDIRENSAVQFKGTQP